MECRLSCRAAGWPAPVRGFAGFEPGCFQEWARISRWSRRICDAGLAGRIDPEQVEAETTAQIRKLQSHGVAVSHVDTHKHTHMFPAALEGILRAARTCGITAIRNPFEVVAANFARAQRGLWKRYAQVKTLRGLAGYFRRAVAKAGLRTPDGTLGLWPPAISIRTFSRTIADNMPEGTWEFVCHPGYVDADLDGIRTRLRRQREEELAVLTSRGSTAGLGKPGH